MTEHKIKVIDNFVSPEDIEVALSFFKVNNKKPFKNIPWVNVLEESDMSISFMKKYSDKALKAHKDIYGIEVPLYTFEGFFTVWDEGFGTNVHSDNHIGAEKVQLTTVIYLNDEYDGGEIYFPEIGFENKPKKGQAVIFPTFTADNPYRHGVKEISNAKRYTLALWHTSFKEIADTKLL